MHLLKEEQLNLFEHILGTSAVGFEIRYFSLFSKFVGVILKFPILSFENPTSQCLFYSYLTCSRGE